MKQWDRERILVKEAKAEGRAEGEAIGEAKGRAEGKAEGKAEEKDHINRLNLILLEQGRIDDLTKAATDATFQDKLIKELLGDDDGNSDDKM